MKTKLDSTNIGRKNMQPLRLLSPILLATCVVTLVACGGSAQFAKLGDIPVRLTSLCLLIAYAPRLTQERRLPLFASLIVAGTILTPALQLIPLPPSFWINLPGRELYAENLRQLGEALPFSPLSFQPWRTLDSLLFLVVPVSWFVVGSALTKREFSIVLVSLLVATALSVAVGAVQEIQGPGSPLRLYAITNTQDITGFFANRNHMAVFLACGIAFATFFIGTAEIHGSILKLASGSALIILFLVCAFLTESRAGMILSVATGVSGFILFAGRKHMARSWISAPLLVGGGLIIYFLSSQVGERFSRLQDANFRADIYPLLSKAVLETWPFGSGVGTFTGLFQQYEPVEYLTPSYWNHAHNDYWQVVIETGVFGLALIVCFFVWWIGAILGSRKGSASFENSVLRLGALLTAILLVHSTVDYPLRTSTLAGVFGLACGLMVRSRTWLRGVAPAAHPS